MKEKISKINPIKGFNKLFRILRFFPFSPDVSESNITRLRNNTVIHDFWNSFWIHVVMDRLDNKGYVIPFKFSGHGNSSTRLLPKSDIFRSEIITILVGIRFKRF